MKDLLIYFKDRVTEIGRNDERKKHGGKVSRERSLVHRFTLVPKIQGRNKQYTDVFPDLPHGGTARARFLFHCFSQANSKELDYKCCSWDLNQHSYSCLCCKRWLNPPCYNAVSKDDFFDDLLLF